MARKIFDGVAGNRPSLNRFDLSYTNTTSMAFGYIYPVQCDECLPGDVFKISAYCHAELLPMVAPIMSDIQLFAHTFFVPYRLLYGVDNADGESIWEKFITGGKDGDYETPLPAWTPSWSVTGFSSKTIWDCIGNPVSYDSTTGVWTPLVPPSHDDGDLVHGTVFHGLDVCIAPKYGYNAIFNAFYRDENLVDEVDKDNEYLLKAAFRKDYFTSALEDQQRGTAPALPVDIDFRFTPNSYFANLVDPTVNITGLAPLVPNLDSSSLAIPPARPYASTESSNLLYNNTEQPVSPPAVGNNYSVVTDGSSFSSSVSSSYIRTFSADSSGRSGTDSFFNHAVTATTFTVSDLRLAFAIQRLQELSMRSGYRYTEWLSAHFNAHPTDARLDRPEYIGGCVMNVSVSPLTQNSGTQDADGTQLTPQGNKSGIGHVDSVNKIGNYRVLEHGLIMTLVSIRPKPIYQQGINRQWLRQSRWDYYMPETAYLSEQAVYNAELFVNGQSGSGEDDDIFGYQAHWNEMRCKNNLVSGAVREQFDYWTLARKFASRPALNQDFIEIDDSDFNKIFAVQDEDPFVVSWSSIIDAYRPIPSMGVPGLIDHVYGGI